MVFPWNVYYYPFLMAIDSNKKDILTEIAAATDGVAAVKSVSITKKPLGSDVVVFADVRYGFSIPEVAWDLQDRIRTALADEINFKTDRINIRITGVVFDAAEENNAKN